MAISIASSTATGILIPAPFFKKSKDSGFYSLLCNSGKPLRADNYASNNSYRVAWQPRVSRLFRIQATTLQEDEDKVVVEKSFKPKSFPEKEGEGTSRTSGESPDGSPPSSGLEKWIIKLSNR